jgi:hypothetical protein
MVGEEFDLVSTLEGVVVGDRLNRPRTAAAGGHLDDAVVLDQGDHETAVGLNGNGAAATQEECVRLRAGVVTTSDVQHAMADTRNCLL